ncbi:hypothetical protein [Chryseobacterium kwangjuense]|uniref:Transposase n=1 Tax=Chryseobacterium kwangjuense TaxID=267125 RepID=A0A135WES7_9FLAO|nr:hypothetical protein [Chryseobacterium kwangjuense]KXH83413.1 transposase [Chryseobacterium kwangjuense]
MENLKKPDYKKIYEDILLKYPHKRNLCIPILSKAVLSMKDVLRLNDFIFPKNTDASTQNQKHRSYDRSSILEILSYQKKNRLNNTQLAIHFQLSRNTVAKWKKQFLL